MGVEKLQRQGFNSALGDMGVRGPINLFGGIPTVATDYSPLWNLNVGVWTEEAIHKDYRSRMIGEFQYLCMVQRGFITALDGSPFRLLRLRCQLSGCASLLINARLAHGSRVHTPCCRGQVFGISNDLY